MVAPMADGGEFCLTGEQAARLRRLKGDFPYYARHCLKIRTKAGEIRPFALNRVQRTLHDRIEAQKARTGKVRAIILKGRQEGCSTYVEGRFYHRAAWARGLRAFILTHTQDASNTIFEMANRFHDLCEEAVKPATGAANAKELKFSELDSGYRVATAGGKGAGRSQTNQLFHGSEVAFWENAREHAAGALQTVPNEPGTEVILESTANGVGNYFHAVWLDAERGQSEYEPIFIPWFWADEYRKPVPAGFTLTVEEREYQLAHGLDLEQMVWRRDKIQELRDPLLFKQEYPATAAEAFETSGADSYIGPALVAKARKAQAAGSGALVIGVDPARFGDDTTSIIRRQGRRAFDLERYKGKDTMEVAGLVARIIEAEKPRRVFVDVGGLGAGVYDRLKELGYCGWDGVVEGVNSGEKPILPDGDKKYLNRRGEMWGEMKAWLCDPAGVQIPDDDVLHGDLTAPRYSYDSLQRLKLERKEDMRSRGLPSPDSGDALALTFAAQVASEAFSSSDQRKIDKWLEQQKKRMIA